MLELVMDRLSAVDDRAERDQIVVLEGVSWADYDFLDRLRVDDVPQPRISYLDGTLQLMTSGRPHELLKKLLARLVEAYAAERGLELIGVGTATFRKRAKQAGLEPDECYWIDDEGDVPDLAIEIVHPLPGGGQVAAAASVSRAVVSHGSCHLRAIPLPHEHRRQAAPSTGQAKGIDSSNGDLELVKRTSP